jgi:hypothetical protein
MYGAKEPCMFLKCVYAFRINLMKQVLIGQ